MRLVKQPEGSVLCGQCCVATIAGVTCGRAVMAMGHKGRTRTKDLVLALGALGIDSGPGWKMGFPKCPTAIIRFTHPSRGSHWVVWHKKKYYDPIAGVSRKPVDYLSESRVTSHLEVRL